VVRRILEARVEPADDARLMRGKRPKAMTARKMLPRLVLCADRVRRAARVDSSHDVGIRKHFDFARLAHGKPSPSGLAPDPAVERGGSPVYSARTFGWRGAFAVHTWLAAKEPGADLYTRYEVIGWYSRMGHSAVSVTNTRIPTPMVQRRAAAHPRSSRRRCAGRHRQAAGGGRVLPAPDLYRRGRVPTATRSSRTSAGNSELRVTLPATAIGKDYLPAGASSRHPERHGLPGLAWSLLGVIAGGDEGFELNVLGLVTGIDFVHPRSSFRE
jgi:hypothetical protein